MMMSVPVNAFMWPASAGVLPPQFSVTVPLPLITFPLVVLRKPGVAAPAVTVLLEPAKMRLLVQALLASAAEMVSEALLTVTGCRRS